MGTGKFKLEAGSRVFRISRRFYIFEWISLVLEYPGYLKMLPFCVVSWFQDIRDIQKILPFCVYIPGSISLFRISRRFTFLSGNLWFQNIQDIRKNLPFCVYIPGSGYLKVYLFECISLVLEFPGYLEKFTFLCISLALGYSGYL